MGGAAAPRMWAALSLGWALGEAHPWAPGGAGGTFGLSHGHGLLDPPAVGVPSGGQGRAPRRKTAPSAVLTRRGSPESKASGRSWAPGSQTLMGPMAEASWY